MPKMIRQTRFSGGEVDVSNYKRTDLQEYLTCAQKLKNAEVSTTTLAKKRKGFTFEGNVTDYASPNSRLYQIIDKNRNEYLLISMPGSFAVFTAPVNYSFVTDNNGAQLVDWQGNFIVNGVNELEFLQTISTPYQLGDLTDIDYANIDDALVLTSPNYPVARIYINYDADPIEFVFEYLDIYPLPSYDFGNFSYAKTLITNFSVTNGIFTFVMSGENANLFTEQWVGGQVRGLGTTAAAPLGYGVITTVSIDVPNPGERTFQGNVLLPFASSMPGSGSQYVITQPLWVQDLGNPFGLGYPACVLYFQSRLWLANTALKPSIVAASKTNQLVNFDVGTGELTDAIVDSNPETGAIYWMNGGKQLEVFALNGEFACPQNENSAISPNSFTLRNQSAKGTSTTLKPLTYINDTYFANPDGKSFLNFHFDGVGLSYVSTNISVAEQHLCKNPTGRALLKGTIKSQDDFIYFVNPDYTITTFQFAQEYKLAALTPMEFQRDTEDTPTVRPIDIICINNTIFLLKYYTLTNTYTIERMNEDIYIDCMQQKTMDEEGLVTGLDMLNGYTVQVLFEGQDFGQYDVVDGEITVLNPQGYTGIVQVGLLYDVDIQTMYVYYSPEASAFFKRVHRIYVDYYKSLNFYVNGTFVPYQTYADIQAGTELEPKTDTAIIWNVKGWNRFETLRITQNSPYDLQITGIGYEIDAAVI